MHVWETSLVATSHVWSRPNVYGSAGCERWTRIAAGREIHNLAKQIHGAFLCAVADVSLSTASTGVRHALNALGKVPDLHLNAFILKQNQICLPLHPIAPTRVPGQTAPKNAARRTRQHVAPMNQMIDITQADVPIAACGFDQCRAIDGGNWHGLPSWTVPTIDCIRHCRLYRRSDHVTACGVGQYRAIENGTCTGV